MSASKQIHPYELFILGLCLFVLGLMGIEATVPLSPDIAWLFWVADTAICGIFLVDFVGRLILAESKLGYLKWGWIDLVSSIPTVGFLRVGRLFRVVRVLRLFRAFRSARSLVLYLAAWRGQATFAVAGLVCIVLLFFGSVTILHAEGGSPDANINSPEAALWWAVVTMTTVGYGDRYPVTTEGHAVAAVLMIAGVGLFGTFTGFIATWFIQPGEEDQEEELADLRKELSGLRAAVERLAESAERRQAGSGAAS